MTFWYFIGAVWMGWFLLWEIMHLMAGGIIPGPPARRRPASRVDYWRIATMEQEVYGHTFYHDGSPVAADDGHVLP